MKFEIDPGVLQTIRRRTQPGQLWAVFQNADLSSRNCGHLQFLKCGDGCTFAEPPSVMPDSHLGIGWRYRFVGTVDLAKGVVIEVSGAVSA